MGCRSSCAIFEAFSTAVEWIAKNELKVAGIAHILDDFLIISNSMNQGYKDLLGFQTMCETLGIPLAPEKTEGPASSLTFAGIELDTIARTARLPAEKLEKAIALVKRALDKRGTVGYRVFEFYLQSCSTGSGIFKKTSKPNYRSKVCLAQNSNYITSKVGSESLALVLATI